MRRFATLLGVTAAILAGMVVAAAAQQPPPYGRAPYGSPSAYPPVSYTPPPAGMARVGGVDDDRLAGALDSEDEPHASAISRAMAAAAARGSAASRMGRPMTRRFAPARIASAGVAMRF